MSSNHAEQPSDDGVSLYVITVDGCLDPDWSPRLGGLQIVSVADGGSQKTQLTGWLKDQSALHGVLATLNSLSMVIVGVERVRTGSTAG